MSESSIVAIIGAVLALLGTVISAIVALLMFSIKTKQEMHTAELAAAREARVEQSKKIDTLGTELATVKHEVNSLATERTKAAHAEGGMEERARSDARDVAKEIRGGLAVSSDAAAIADSISAAVEAVKPSPKEEPPS